MISQSKLDFYIQNALNVLFIGRHGTGKTSSVIEAFNRNKLKWLYFSSATMDPWVDFVGIPKETTDKNGITYLDLVRPKAFAYDEVEAIFFDEYNRGNEKVRNATLELIQFKSINGKKFNNLKFVWGAINPDDDISCYDVQKLDMAQKDRFQIHVEVPYELDMDYFSKKYGPVIAKRVNDWWTQLGDTQKNDISPRRMDYAIEIFNLGGDLHDVLPKNANITYLISVLQKNSVKHRLEAIMKSGNGKEAESILKNDTEYTEAIKWILEDPKRSEFFLPLINEEKYMGLMNEHMNNDAVMASLLAPFDSSPTIRKTIMDCHNKPELKNCIIKHLPSADVSQFGKLAAKVPNFNVTRGCVDGFFDKVNEFNSKNTTVKENLTMYDWIKNNIGVTTHKNGDCITTIMFLTKRLYEYADKKALLKDYPDFMPVMNHCLKTMEGGVNVVTDERLKVIGKKLLKFGLQDEVWIPATKKESK